MEGRHRDRTAEALGVPGGTLRSWLSKGSIPPPGTIADIARFCDCTLGYLVDDQIPVDADPRSGGVDAHLIAPQELTGEVLRRYLKYAGELAELLEEIEKIDWPAIGARLAEAEEPINPMDTPEAKRGDFAALAKRMAQAKPFIVSGLDRAALELATRLPSVIATSLQPFYLARFDADPWEGAPGREVPPDHLKLGAIQDRIQAIFGQLTPNEKAKTFLGGWLSAADDLLCHDPEAGPLIVRDALQRYRWEREKQERGQR